MRLAERTHLLQAAVLRRRLRRIELLLKVGTSRAPRDEHATR